MAVLGKSKTALCKLVAPNHECFTKRSRSPQTSETSESARRSSQIEVRVVCKERESARASVLNLTLRQSKPNSKSPNLSKGPRDADIRQKKTRALGSPLIKIIGSGSPFLIPKSPKGTDWKPNMRLTHRNLGLSESKQNPVSIVDEKIRRNSTSEISGPTHRHETTPDLQQRGRCFNAAGFEDGNQFAHDPAPEFAKYAATQSTQWKKKCFFIDRQTQTQPTFEEFVELKELYVATRRDLDRKCLLINELLSTIRNQEVQLHKITQMLNDSERREVVQTEIAEELDLRWESYSNLYDPMRKAPDVTSQSDRGAGSTAKGGNTRILASPSLQQHAKESFHTQQQLPPHKCLTPEPKIQSLSSLIAVFQNASVVQEDFEDVCARLMDDSSQELVSFLVQIRQELSGLRQDVAILKHERGLNIHCCS